MDRAEMLELAAFNKLALSEEESGQMETYLGYALGELDKLTAADTAGVEPLIFCVEKTNVFRADVVAKTVSREQILANAPEQSEGCFQVPKVVE